MTLEIGKTYRIKLTSGEWTDGRFDGLHESGVYLGSGRRTHKRYHFTNLRTGREIVLKSLAKVKEVVPTIMNP